MTRIFTEGFESADGLFWTTAGGGLTASSRSGTYAWNLYGDCVKTFTALVELYAGFGYYNNLSATTTSQIFCRWRNGNFSLGYLRLNEIGLCEVWIGTGSGTLVATGTHVLPNNGWSSVELHFTYGAGGGVQVKINGFSDINYAGDTTIPTYLNISNLLFRGGYIDDIGMNDTAGGADNSWLGEEHIEALIPNANGDVNSWTNSAGTKVNNWSYVDERPPNSDADYVKSVTATEQDMYNMTDYDATGKASVQRIYSEVRAKDNNGASGPIKIGFKTLGSVYLCAANRVLTNAYARYVGDEALVNPNSGSAWTDANLDAIQFVVECE